MELAVRELARLEREKSGEYGTQKRVRRIKLFLFSGGWFVNCWPAPGEGEQQTNIFTENKS